MHELYYGYLQGCQSFNELNDLPEQGWEWHHILPQCLFGDQPFGLWLTKEQHSVASVLQSYAFGTCCITGMMKKHLPEKWHPLFRFWRAKAMIKINKEKTPEERTMAGRRGINSPQLIASRYRENYTPERLEQRKQWGRTSHTPESRREAGRTGGEKGKGLLCWVNETGKIKRSRECPGQDWQRGRKWKEQ